MNDSIISSNSSSDWSTVFSGITAVASFVSMLILYFYAYFTRKMQQAIEKQVKEQNRQTEELIHQRRLGIMPSILVEVNENSVIAKNVGNGTALNIKFETTINNEKLYSEGFRYEIENILMILPEETKETKIHNESDSKLPTNFTGLNVPGKITFQDIEGNNYNQILENLDKTRKLRYGFPVLIEKTEIVKTCAKSI